MLLLNLRQSITHQITIRARHSAASAFRDENALFGRSNNNRRRSRDPPKLILISGCTGTGKSTFGMSCALEQGILKCISTDIVRAVMRSYIPEEISPPLHRSSYASSASDEDEDGTTVDDPVKSWLETCKVLDSSVSGLVDDAIYRGASLVLEGVSIVPSRQYIDRFIANAPGGDGMACGVLLVVSDEERHRQLLRNRGVVTGNNEAEERKVRSFHRIRAIQDEMIRRANECGWTLIEQRGDLDPLDVVSEALYKGSSDGGITTRTSTTDAVDEDEFSSKP